MSAEIAPAVGDWAARVKARLNAVAEEIVAAGRELLAAKEALPHGSFGDLLEEVHLSPRTAQRLMAIARHPTLADPTRVSHLPSAWGTLYELSRLSPAALEAAIDAGDVTPAMRRQDAEDLASFPAAPRLRAINEALGLFSEALTAWDSSTMSPEDSIRVLSEIKTSAEQAGRVAARIVADYDGRLMSASYIGGA